MYSRNLYKTLCSAAIPPRKAGISRHYQLKIYADKDIMQATRVLQSRLEKQAFQGGKMLELMFTLMLLRVISCNPA